LTRESTGTRTVLSRLLTTRRVPRLAGADATRRNKMKLKVSIVLAVVVALASMAAFASPPASAAPPSVTTTAVLTNAGQVVEGTLSNLRVVNQAGELVLRGTFTDTAGNVTNFTTPILDATAVGGTCEILDLTLGPLDLNLLGLVVHLDQVHLTIDAQSGPGNLLGNLLCGVAGLLDSGASNNVIANLLNQLLGLLNL
jgi:hypothetical protein